MINNEQIDKSELFKKDAVIVYRKNEVFDKILGIAKQALLDLGCPNVTIQSFEGSTDREDIKQWYRENTKTTEGKIILTDETSRKYGSLECTLDDFANQAVSDVFKTEIPEIIVGDYCWYTDKIWQNFKNVEYNGQMIKHILSNLNRKIKTVYIIETRDLEDHNPFRDVDESQAANYVKSWVSESLPNDTSITIVTNPKELLGKDIDLDTTLFIHDRHMRYLGDRDTDIPANWPERTLKLPIETFVSDAIKTKMYTAKNYQDAFHASVYKIAKQSIFDYIDAR